MTTRNVLFISGSIGLGHVTRDLAIAAALRAHRPEVRLVWLAGHPAQQALQTAGEKLVPECQRYADETAFVEAIAGPFSMRLLNPMAMFTSPRKIRAWWQMLRGQKGNVTAFKEVTARQRFDLIIADEAYELAVALRWVRTSWLKHPAPETRRAAMRLALTESCPPLYHADGSLM